jgi:hypothetical protein
VNVSIQIPVNPMEVIRTARLVRCHQMRARHDIVKATASIQYYKILTLQPVYPVKNANTSDRRFREIPAHVILGDAREGCKHGD